MAWKELLMATPMHQSRRVFHMLGVQPKKWPMAGAASSLSAAAVFAFAVPGRSVSCRAK